MDLSSLKPVETVTINLRHPVTAEPLGLSLEVCGRDSKKFAQARHKMVAERERMTTGRRTATTEQQEQLSLGLLLDCVCGWAGDWVFDGQKLVFGREVLAGVLKELPWIREQIDEAVGDRANFLPKQPSV